MSVGRSGAIASGLETDQHSTIQCRLLWIGRTARCMFRIHSTARIRKGRHNLTLRVSPLKQGKKGKIIDQKLTEHRSDALAVGSVKLDALDCTAAEEGSAVCMLPAGTQPTLTTKGGPAHLESGASCPARSETYQSWQLEQWVREYGLPPGSTTPGSDTGPSFTLKNMANSDVFNCAPLAHENGTFAGNCEWAGAGNATDATTATFTFDPQLDSKSKKSF